MSGAPALQPMTLTDAQFDRISELVRELCGINLHNGKEELVKARLGKRLRALGLTSLDAYLRYVQADGSGAELAAMLDALSTNLTKFFREPDHFHYLQTVLVPRWLHEKASSRRIRIWSAGCSSGEEPYTIAMCLRESARDFDSWDVGILATDLSRRVLAEAKEGVYDSERAESIPPELLRRYFVCRKGLSGAWQAGDDLKRLVRFCRLNLMDSWPMRGPFDAIFCRNVMIYFDKSVQEQLIQRFWSLLADGGTLFIGHSESLSGVRHGFNYVCPTIYQK